MQLKFISPEAAEQTLRKETIYHYWQNHNPQFWHHCQAKGLSDQETLIGDLLCANMRNKEIAYRLGVEQATVTRCLSRIYRKLGVTHLPRGEKRIHAVRLLRAMGANYQPLR